MRRILFVLVPALTLTFVLLLNGNIQISSNPLPPFGKFLNPFKGVWQSNLHNETQEMNLQMKGLTAPVKILYDDRRVPHIFAGNLEDALFAQGFVQAQNRLFQMDFVAKAAAGELSSVLGDKTLEIDREKRRRGMKFAAENAVKGWEQFPEFRKYMDAYISGVNAYIHSLGEGDYPLEYKLLDYAPESWDALKSALIFKYMSLTLAGRNDDIRYTNLYNLLGKESFDFLYPETEEIENPVIPDLSFLQGADIDIPHQSDSAYYTQSIQNAFYDSRPSGVGSNSWGVGGLKTASGKPIFCNDPHLSLGLPSIWFEIHLHTPQFNAYGVSIPGMPGIMIGFNEFIAWGETNVGQDVEDLFVIEWADDKRSAYMLDGKVQEVRYRIETHKIKGGKDLTDTVRYTHWGPVYHSSKDGKHDLAMRWLVHDVPDTPEFMVFVQGMQCKNYEEYLEVTSNFIAPAQNFGFASVDGDIALRVNGRFPAKSPNDGRFVEYGNVSANGWQKFIPRAQNPQILNPSSGYIASANQRSAPKDYPYYYTGKFEHFRNKTINGKLTAAQDVTTEDIKVMQTDAYSSKAADIVPFILSSVDKTSLTGLHAEIYEAFQKWDYQYRSYEAAPTYFELFFRRLQEKVWDEITPFQKDYDVVLPKPWRLIALMKKDSENIYFDIKNTEAKESALDIVRLAFEDLVSAIRDLKEKNQALEWGKYRPLDIHHLIRLPALSELGLPADGCPDVINATGLSFGPSWRMIVNLEEKVSAYAVYPGGQSGNPFSPYYKNMIPTWLKGEYFPVRFVHNAEDVQSHSTQIIHLTPQK